MTRSARLLASAVLVAGALSGVTYALWNRADDRGRVAPAVEPQPRAQVTPAAAAPGAPASTSVAVAGPGAPAGGAVAAPKAGERGVAPGGTAQALFGDAAPQDDDASYPLDALQVYSRAIAYVSENYVDPKRVDPKAMVAASLDYIERTVAEVMVDGDVASGKLNLTVGSASRTLDVSGVNSIFKVRAVMVEAVSFIQQHLVAHKNLREIEYAATNGLLSTLDPHSLLLDGHAYKEMRVQTRGEFGGLGFVIAMRDSNLTVVRVLKNTPAQRAGIRAKDVIVKIGEQSTVNMDLTDAVDRLRGKPGTKVNITVLHPPGPERRLELARDTITVESVPQARLLEGGVGYVKISGFAGNTSSQLEAAIHDQQAEAGGALKGLILDLRGNPGGLLDQAKAIADLFLSEGVIVKTVGEGVHMNEAAKAHADRNDILNLPLVVIVNNSSASASEIVAGALKNNGRALVIGRQTFGKGSVQVLYDFADPAAPEDSHDDGKDGNDILAVKLTVAQYLTPGDVSIQEVGVTPDVLLLPGRALKDSVNYFAPPRMLIGEADLDHHFTNPGDAQLSQAERAKRERERLERTEKAPVELRYLLDEKEDAYAKALKADEKREAAAKARAEAAGNGAEELTPEQQEDEEADANPDEMVEDYQIRFARDLLARAPGPGRAQLLEAAKTFAAERRVQEEARLKARLAALGVDWSAGPPQGTARPVVSVTPGPGKLFTAGEKVPLTVTVENRGDGALRQLRGWAIADKDPLLDRREFVFGLVKPGERRSWTVPIRVPRHWDSRYHEVKLHFEEENGRAPADAVGSLEIVSAARPTFAFSTQVDDDAGGNGDGLVHRGETFLLRADVKNEGLGASGETTFVLLKNLGDEKVFIKKGRAVIGALQPGQTKTATFEVEVKHGLKADKMPLQIAVADDKLGEYVLERLEVPVGPEARGRVAKAAGGARVTAAPEAVLRTGAAEGAPAIAVAKRGTVLKVTGRAGAFYKVEWEKGRSAFAAADDVAPARSAPSGAPVEVWQRQPPRIAMTPDPARGAPVVTTDHLHLTGTASAPAPLAGERTRLRDLFVYCNDQKVFFKVVPEANAAGRVDFATDVPLKPGNNVVTVFAREDEEFQTHRTINVYRRAAPAVAQQGNGPQPKAAQQQ